MKRVVKPKGLFAYPSQSNRRRKTTVRYVSKAYREYLERLEILIPLRLSNSMLLDRYSRTANYWSEIKLRRKQAGSDNVENAGEATIRTYDRRIRVYALTELEQLLIAEARRALMPRSYTAEEVLTLARDEALDHRRQWDAMLARARRDRDNEIIHFDKNP